MNKYLDRDLSWFSFNNRVLDESSKNIPLEEKINFIGITGSNIDEYFMTRYPSILYDKNINKEEIILESINNLQSISNEFENLNKKQNIVFKITRFLDSSILSYLKTYFKNNVFPLLQPISIDSPIDIKSNTLGIFIETKNKKNRRYFNYVEVPPLLDRFIKLPNMKAVVTIEDLIINNLKYLLKDMDIISANCFRVLRNAEVIIQDDSLNQYELIKMTLKEREKSWITLLEVNAKGDDLKIINNIKKFLNVTDNTITVTTKFVAFKDLKNIDGIYDKNEKRRKFKGRDFFQNGDVFDSIKSEDKLAFHPFDSFNDSFIKLIQESAKDKNVISIKITLYRVAKKSKIIEALLHAAENGKSVTVLVELKARFDEKNNILVSKILKEAGVKIVYGNLELKTHAKICLINRKEDDKIITYSHIGTGNYNEMNSKIYTDYSYFTTDSNIGNDLTRFFNLLTSEQTEFKSKEILYAPHNLRKSIVDYIDSEIKKKKKGRIIFKCNSLTDDKIADKLYEASKAGVKITLIIRGACIIRPMIKGLSENIKIYSIVGRFLEHSRVYLFGRGVKQTILIGSSDIMHRNLNTRNELLLIVKKPNIKEIIKKHISIYIQDNINRSIILDNYQYINIKENKKQINCHDLF